MRPELELLAKIDAYINGKLSTNEKTAFEIDIVNSTELKTAVENQRTLRDGINYIAVKEKTEIAYKKHLYKKWLKLFTVVFITLAIGILAYQYTEYLNDEKDVSIREVNNQITRSNLETKSKSSLPETDFEIFTILTNKDTVFETKNGTVIAIPKHAFNSKNIEFKVKEIFTPYDIIMNNLSTLSDSIELETAGMFLFEAYDNGRKIELNPNKEIIVEVPTNDKKTNMQLYDGEILNSERRVNWKNPVALDNYLTTLDIHTLNFYPEGFEKKLLEVGLTNTHKSYKDSVFYSFTCLNQTEGTTAKPLVEIELEDDSISKDTDENIDYSEYKYCNGIEPSSIKAIWNKHYQNTFIATKEFEERLQIIYKTCNPVILELYIKNLELPLWKIDLKASKICPVNYKKDFLKFSELKHTNVKSNETIYKKLNAYYEQKSKLYKHAVQKSYTSFIESENKLNNTINHKKQQQENKEEQIKASNLQQEFEINLKSVYEQAKLPMPALFSSNRSKYQFRISSLGWKNIDRKVYNATVDRKSFVSTLNNKTVKITYSDISIALSNNTAYDYVKVYLTSSDINSYIKLKKEGENYKYSLNDLLKYNLIVIGYSDSEPHIYGEKQINSGNQNINLKYIPNNELNDFINLYSYNRTKKEIHDDLNFESLIRILERKRERIKEQKKIRKLLELVIFPCSSTPSNESD